jgi:hypothetical protein
MTILPFFFFFLDPAIFNQKQYSTERTSILLLGIGWGAPHGGFNFK